MKQKRKSAQIGMYKAERSISIRFGYAYNLYAKQLWQAVGPAEPREPLTAL